MLVTLVIFNCLFLANVVRGSPVAMENQQKIEKRSTSSSERFVDDYPDYQVGVRYDEYPMIVPKKRTALLVNRIMHALKDALDEDERDEFTRRTNKIDGLPNKKYSDDVRGMDLQRRGHGGVGNQKGRIYWRCYFNAVTCF